MHRVLVATALVLVACSSPAKQVAVEPGAPERRPAAPADASPGRPTALGVACNSNGHYGLGPAVEYAAKGASGELAVGDLNGDGHPDVIVGVAGSVGVFLGKGDGTFASVVIYPLGDPSPVRSVALADYDADGDVDVVTAGNAAQVLLNNGDGTFGAPVPLPTRAAMPARWIRTADVDRDGNPDVLELGDRSVALWLDSGHARFAEASPIALDNIDRAYGLAIADFDGDGGADAAIAGTAGAKSVLDVLLNQPHRGFAAPIEAPLKKLGGNVANGITTGDFDGDSKPDLATLYVPEHIAGTISVWRNTGHGRFASYVELTVPAGAVDASIAAADFNGDGRTDLAVSLGDGIAVYLNTGQAAFAPPVIVPASGARALAAGDFKGDKLFGLVAIRPDRGVVVLPGSCE